MNTNVIGIFSSSRKAMRTTDKYINDKYIYLQEWLFSAHWRLVYGQVQPYGTIQQLLQHDAYHPIASKILSSHILHRLSLMCRKTSRKLKEAQTQYRWYLDQSVHNLPIFCPRDYVYIDLPPALKSEAERTADDPWWKLLPNAVGPFPITACQIAHKHY